MITTCSRVNALEIMMETKQFFTVNESSEPIFILNKCPTKGSICFFTNVQGIAKIEVLFETDGSTKSAV